MYNDETLRGSVRAALTSQPAPPVDLAAILRREPRFARPRAASRRLSLTAAAVLVLAALPFVHANAIFAAVSSDVRVVLHAFHLPGSVPVTETVLSTLRAQTHTTTVAQASREVPFTLVPPSGMPADAHQTRLYTTHPAVWSAQAHRFTVGAPVVIWRFTRENGKTFELHAAAYDPHARYFAYMWQPVEDAHGKTVTSHGHPVVIRHDAFFWRNGDQVMSAFTGRGISREEIAAIRRSMNGVAIPSVRTNAPHGGRRLMLVKP